MGSVIQNLRNVVKQAEVRRSKNAPGDSPDRRFAAVFIWRNSILEIGWQTPSDR
jgi:hypothetical protein